MDNLNNIDKIKGKLTEELDTIKEEKRIILDELRNLQKEDFLIGANIEFFKKYLKLLDTKTNVDISLDDFFISSKSKSDSEIKPNEKRMDDDIIEENVRAFDNSNYSFQNPCTNNTHENKKKTPSKKHQSEEVSLTGDHMYKSTQDKGEHFNEENFYHEIIKQNFEN